MRAPPRSAASLAVALIATVAPAGAAERAPAYSPPILRPSLSPEASGVYPGAATLAEDGPDAAFSAYQRGYYRTAYAAALKRLKVDPQDAAAMALIGQTYLDGAVLRRDETEAARWMALAAERGYAPAQFALGMAKVEGKGVAKDVAAGKALLEKAAEAGHAGALYNLGVLAIADDPKDFAAAAGYFRRAAEAGDPAAAYSLALLYREGAGVEKSPTEAARWMKQAADERNVAGEIEYALMLFNGIGVAKDEPAAARLLLRAANQDNPSAQNRLARILATGRGLPKDMVEAMKWHILARTAGVKDEWLDAQMTKLSTDQRAKVDEAVRRYLGR